MRIFEFANVSAWDDRLNTLAAMAEPERWNYLSVPTEIRHPVLDRYIKYTFMRAYDQQKIVEGDQTACFNTGLLTPGHEEIFGIFTLNQHFDRARPLSAVNKKWWLKTWAPSGDRMMTDFLEFPKLADYWTDSRDLIFDPKLQVQLNLHHIAKDNLNRFPEELGGRVNRDGVPTDLAAADADGDIEAIVGAAVEEAPLKTRNALEGAMEHSIRLAKRSYRIAVPQFYQGKIQLLLPLYFNDSARPDLALTLERHGGWYRAATILYTDWAYTHARLLARPNSEWLGGFSGEEDAEAPAAAASPAAPVG